jgi:hypothetical protein
MIWYGISVDSVHYVFKNTLELIRKAQPPIELPKSDDEWSELVQGWTQISLEKKGVDVIPGTALAGDGLAIETNAPSETDRGDISLASFRNRKGFFALICQAFCDCNAKFRMFEIAWPGSTNDIIAYRQSNLYKLYKEGKVPEWVHFVLDEAYSSIGGNQHLTPYSRNQLRRVRYHDGAGGEEKYLKMKGFNNALSSQRITIERAFGILIRRWGILAKSLAFDIKTNALVAYVCAQLHNRCMDRWLKRQRREQFLEPPIHSHDVGAFLLQREGNDLGINDDIVFPNDEFIIANYTEYLIIQKILCPSDSCC